MKLSEEQHREMFELIEGDSFKTLINIVLPQFTQKMVDRMLSVDFNKNAQELLVERARLDGALRLANDIKELKTYFRKVSTNQRKNA